MIAIAKHRGLRVLADASPEDEELVRSFGADVVLPRGGELAAAVRQAVPGGVDAVFDTALLGRGMFPAIRDGGAIAVVRGWDGDDVEHGIRIQRVMVGTVLDRTDWLREAARARRAGRAGAAGRRHVSRRSAQPTRNGGWRPAACAAAP